MPKKRLPPSRQRFQIFGQVVEDTFTGAIWTKNANPAEFPLSWHEARRFAADLRSSRAFGRSDWQLPSRRLLFALISHQQVNPALGEGHPFEAVFPGYYWTGESCHRLANQAWYIHLGGGRVHRGMKQGAYLVWPVAMPEAAGIMETGEGPARFAVQKAGIFDSHTGLTWSRDADPAGGPSTWQQALSAVQALNQAGWQGHTDWRMPNIRELESLVCLRSHSPALPADHPFVRVRDAYWSSTTSVYEPRYAWALYIQDGIVGVAFKPSVEFHLWPVYG